MKKELVKKKISFFSIAFTFFVDYLSWSIVFPIFAPYFLDVNNPLFGSGVELGTRTLVLGFFVMAFSFGQFLGSPLIGEYADRNGRKKALGFSVFLTFLGLCLTAYSMKVYNLYLLFTGRLVTGFFASSASVCLSSISDLSRDEKEKVKNFGTLSMLGGLSFILGAFSGGKLSSPDLHQVFSFDFPIWVAAGVTLLNFFFILFGFEETVHVDPSVKFHFLESFKNIQLALKTKKIKRIYTIYFLFLIAWTILFQFVPVLSVKKFSFTSSTIGNLAVFMGICWALGSGYINRFLTRHFNSMIVLEVCLLGFTLLCGSIAFPKSLPLMIGTLGLCILLASVAWPICTGLISDLAPQHMQGKVMGLSQSVQSLAMSVGPLLGGIAFHESMQLPFLLAGLMSLTSGVVYFFVLKGRE